MKIVFMGTPQFAVPSLKILHDKYKVDAVVTVPDKRKGRGLTEQYSDVKKFAVENGISVIQPENLKDKAFADELKSLEPDIIAVVAFRIMPESIFSIPKLGIFNLHASLLPRYRGAAPINRAIMNGETETGITTFFLSRKVDTGNIIFQERIAIDEDDDAGSLSHKLSLAGAELVLKTTEAIAGGKVLPLSQDDSLATAAPKIFTEDCRIDWNKSAVQIRNQIRGLSPVPGAFTYFGSKLIKIYKAIATDRASATVPGIAFAEGKRLFISTGTEMLEAIELQPEGKKRMSAGDFINGVSNRKEIRFTNTPA